MKINTIKENKVFRRLYHRGKSAAGTSLVTYVMKSNMDTKVGITSSKKIGNAVSRNRARRVIRAAYSTLESRVQGKWNIVFVARTRATCVKMQDVLSDMEKELLTLGVIK